MEHMENSVEVLCLFNGRDVGWLFDHADQSLIARWAGAIRARIDVGDVVANRAQAQIGFDIAHRGSQGLSIFVARAENVESQALRALGSDAWKLFQLIDQARHGFGKFRHKFELRITLRWQTLMQFYCREAEGTYTYSDAVSAPEKAYSNSYECFPSAAIRISIFPLIPASSPVPESGTTVIES